MQRLLTILQIILGLKILRYVFLKIMFVGQNPDNSLGTTIVRLFWVLKRGDIIKTENVPEVPPPDRVYSGWFDVLSISLYSNSLFFVFTIRDTSRSRYVNWNQSSFRSFWDNINNTLPIWVNQMNTFCFYMVSKNFLYEFHVKSVSWVDTIEKLIQHFIYRAFY